MNDPILSPLAGTTGWSRRHAIKVFTAAAGGVLFGIPRRAPAQLPWGEPEHSALLSASGSPLRLGEGQAYPGDLRQAAPTLTFEPKGARLWTSWTRAGERGDEIVARSFDVHGEQWGGIVGLGRDPGGSREFALDSAAAIVGDRLVVVWCAWSTDGWALRSASVDCVTGRLMHAHLLTGGAGTGEVHWHPAVASNGTSALAVWQAKSAPGEAFGIRGCFLGPDGAPQSEPFPVRCEDGQDCCRPHVAVAPDGLEFVVALDRQEGPAWRRIELVRLDAARGESGAPTPVSEGCAADTAPSVAYSPDGALVWIAWHSNREGADRWGVRPWYRLAAMRRTDGSLSGPMPAADHDLPEERGTIQGFEFPRLAVSPGGVVCVLGRPSHGFYVQYYDREGRSPLYRLPEDGWGGRGRLLNGAFDTNGRFWVARRDLHTNVLHRIEGFGTVEGPPPLRRIGAPRAAVAPSRAEARPRYAWPDTDARGDDAGAARKELNVYFGDIHGHSWQSDGMGDPEEAYLRARDVYRDDFHVLTDHDRFVGKRLMDAQWEQQKAVADHYHAPGVFVTLYGQEWTTARISHPRGWGHFNIYSADSRTPLFDHGDTRFRDLPGLLAALPAFDAVAVPHHIGWTGVRWDVWDENLIPVVEICSVHGVFEYEGNEPIRHRGGMKGCFALDGLAAGRTFGFVGGSDQHGLLWHHGVCWKANPFRAGLTGVWAPALTREAIMKALRSRRTFATTGVKLVPKLTVDGALPGDAVTIAGPPELRADVAVPPEEGRLGWIELVRDGIVIYRYGGEGQQSRFTFVDRDAPEGTSTCYYLRIILEDDNMAWTSPIRVVRT